MFILCFKKLGGGVGRRLCMPSYTGNSDSVFKEKKFILKKLRHNYENVLLFGDVKKLRETAEELIKSYRPSKGEINNALLYTEEIRQFLKKKNIENEDAETKKDESINVYSENNTEKEETVAKHTNVMVTNEKTDNFRLIKKTSFWQIYSMRVKKSAHLLSHLDFALILQSFHLHNKDTGVYSSCVKYIEKEIPKMNGLSYVLLLSILSSRLKKNSYNALFEKMGKYIPNILFELNMKDIVNILNCFHNIELQNKIICDNIYNKVLNNLHKTDSDILSSLCYIFYQYNFEKKAFFESLKKRGMELLNNFNAQQFYKFIFSLYKKQVCLKDIIDIKKKDIYSFLSEYNEEQKMFVFDILGMH